MDALDADRASHSLDAGARDAKGLEAVYETLLLRLRSDQPEKAEVATLEDRFRDPQVEVVLVREHEIERPGGCGSHFGLDRVDADFADVRRPAGRVVEEARRKLLVALVDPVDDDIERRERACDGSPDMPRAIELQVEHRRGRRPARQRRGVECLEAQRHGTAAALAERGAERVVLAARRVVVGGEHVARRLYRLEFEVPAADGAGRLRRGDEHARASLARHGTACLGDFDEDGGRVGMQPGGGGVAQMGHGMKLGGSRALTPALSR